MGEKPADKHFAGEKSVGEQSVGENSVSEKSVDVLSRKQVSSIYLGSHHRFCLSTLCPLRFCASQRFQKACILNIAGSHHRFMASQWSQTAGILNIDRFPSLFVFMYLNGLKGQRSPLVRL